MIKDEHIFSCASKRSSSCYHSCDYKDKQKKPNRSEKQSLKVGDIRPPQYKMVLLNILELN